MGANVAEDELITVRERPRNAIRAGHSAGSADIFDNDLLTQMLRKVCRQDAPDDVYRAASGKRNYHGHWPGRPVLRSGWRRHGHKRGSRRQMEKLTTWNFHDVSDQSIGHTILRSIRLDA